MLRAQREEERKGSAARKVYQRVRTLRRYGLAQDAFDRMLQAQGGVCAICGASSAGGVGRWHIDHDHRFKANDPRSHRGLLCHHCNTALGNFKDSPELLRAAAAYVRRHKELARTAPVLIKRRGRTA